MQRRQTFWDYLMRPDYPARSSAKCGLIIYVAHFSDETNLFCWRIYEAKLEDYIHCLGITQGNAYLLKILMAHVLKC